MRTIQLLILVFITSSTNISCQAQSDKQKDNPTISKTDEIEVFYFHYTRRCVTCKAVEDVSRDAVTELYEEMIPFTGYNLEEEEGKEKARDLGVSGQALLIVCGDTRINITNEGFMYARNNPEKLKLIISEKINSLM